MPAWTCPQCGRQFGRNKQSHECAPAMTLDEYFSTGPERERPIFDAVMGYLDGVGPVHVEPVSVGIFLKNPRKFAELRPMQNWVAISFSLSRTARHRLLHEVPRLAQATIHSSPATADGSDPHGLTAHHFARPVPGDAGYHH